LSRNQAGLGGTKKKSENGEKKKERTPSVNDLKCMMRGLTDGRNERKKSHRWRWKFGLHSAPQDLNQNWERKSLQ